MKTQQEALIADYVASIGEYLAQQSITYQDYSKKLTSQSNEFKEQIKSEWIHQKEFQLQLADALKEIEASSSVIHHSIISDGKKNLSMIENQNKVLKVIANGLNYQYEFVQQMENRLQSAFDDHSTMLTNYYEQSSKQQLQYHEEISKLQTVSNNEIKNLEQSIQDGLLQTTKRVDHVKNELTSEVMQVKKSVYLVETLLQKQSKRTQLLFIVLILLSVLNILN